MMYEPIITVGRQYGSGGRYVARLLAEKLGGSGGLETSGDMFPQICPDNPELAGMIRVWEPPELYFWMDSIWSTGT